MKLTESKLTESEVGATRKLAARALAIKYADLDARTIAHAKMLLLDQVGVLLVGSTLPWTKMVYRHMTSFGGDAQARVVLYGNRLAVHDAAFVNAVFAQGCEFDDFSTRNMGGGHGGAGTWPIALAMGELLHISGKELLAAGVVGYECMARIGKAVRPFGGVASYPVHGMLSPFGSVGATGWLLNLTEHEMTMAISLAASQCGGINEYGRSGGEVKRLHAGIGARAGIQSAYLSRQGFTGPPTALEGEAGLVRSYGAKPKIEEIDKPSDEYAIMESGPKIYPTAGVVNTCIEAMEELKKKHGFTHQDIENIDIAMAAWSIEHAGLIYEPTDCASAQYSVPYSVALQAVVGSNDLANYMDAGLWRDERIKNISRRVKFSVSDKAAGDARHSCLMNVTLKNGSKHEVFKLYPRGSFLNPISPEDTRAKFVSLAQRVVGDKRTSELIEAVDHVDSMHDVTGLIDLMCLR